MRIELGTIVMGTGIVALALWLGDDRVLASIGLALTAIAWLLLAGSSGVRWGRGGRASRLELGSPSELAYVAATAVLGSLLVVHGLRVRATVVLALAVVLEVALLPAVLRRRRLPRAGSVFMLTVSVQSVAALGAAIARSGRVPWLVWASLAVWTAGVASYPYSLARFDLRQVRRGRGDHWVAGGALAISSLAIAEITLAAGGTPVLRHAVSVLEGVSLAVWIASLVWLVVLVVAEVAAPRIHYDPRRWSTVFPVGMYAAASFQVARVSSSAAIHSFASAWTWVALAVWTAAVVGVLRPTREV